MVELSFFKEYIYSPPSKLHFTKVRIKMSIICLYIILLPFIYTYILFINTSILFYLLFSGRGLPRISSLFSRREFFVFCLLLVVVIITESSGSFIIIALPYQLKFAYCLTARSSYLTMTNIISLTCSEVTARTYLLLLKYFILQRIIMSTTQIEDIMADNLAKIDNIVSFNFLIDEIKIIVLLAYQFTYTIEDEVKNVIISYYSKTSCYSSANNLICKCKFIILLIYLSLIQLNTHILLRAQTLYTREIKISQNQYWLM